MPRLPTDYSKTVIYKLVHKDDTDNKNVYVGSTTDFRKRKNAHKTVCNNPNSSCYNDPKYQFIRDNGGWNEWIMIEIEKYPCNDKREAEARERYWIEYYKAPLNMCIPTRNMKEWRETNKEDIKQKKIEYYQKNKEWINEKTRNNSKLYYQKNKTEVNKKSAENYFENRERVLKYRCFKIECECGMMVSRSNISCHRKKMKHLALMEKWRLTTPLLNDI